MKSDDSLVLCVKSDAAVILLLGEIIDDWPISVQLPPDEQPHDAWLEVFCDSPEDLYAKRSVLSSILEHAGVGADISERVIEACDWREKWKEHFHVMRVSPRIVIRPSWEPYTPVTGDCVVTMDPGLNFGTGQHGTTQACLQFLDEFQKNLPSAGMLDIGCGSGILAIAAAKLGFTSVVAFDNDPDAVRIAQENCRLNGTDAVTKLTVADLGAYQDEHRYELVIANILASVLIQYSKIVGERVADGSNARLVLSGILQSQYDAVRECYQTLGYEEENRITLGMWTTGIFAHRA